MSTVDDDSIRKAIEKTGIVRGKLSWKDKAKGEVEFIPDPKGAFLCQMTPETPST